MVAVGKENVKGFREFSDAGLVLIQRRIPGIACAIGRDPAVGGDGKIVQIRPAVFIKQRTGILACRIGVEHPGKSRAQQICAFADHVVQIIEVCIQPRHQISLSVGEVEARDAQLIAELLKGIVEIHEAAVRKSVRGVIGINDNHQLGAVFLAELLEGQQMLP